MLAPQDHSQEDTRPVAIVLGAAVWADGPSPTLRRRAMRAITLWNSGAVRHIIACGGVGRHPPAEATAIRDILIAGGVPTDCISAEAASTTTRENIALALPILKGLRAEEVIVVTDAWHVPRARLVARRLGLGATGAAPPLHGTHPGRQARMALRETLAYLWHWIAFWP